MGIPTTNCPIQIQVWVDDNAVQINSTRGVYLVDNRTNAGSEAEGTPSLSTAASKGSNICWQAFLINKNSTSQVSIASISNANVFGASGQPQRAPDIQSAFTGQLQNGGSSSYTLTLNVISATGSATTVTVNPNLAVSA